MAESTKLAQRMKLSDGSLASLSMASTESRKRKSLSRKGDRYEGFTGYGVDQDDSDLQDENRDDRDVPSCTSGKRKESTTPSRRNRATDSSDSHPPTKKHKSPQSAASSSMNELHHYFQRTPLSDKSNASPTKVTRRVEAEVVLKSTQEQVDMVESTRESTFVADGVPETSHQVTAQKQTSNEKQESSPTKKTPSKTTKAEPKRLDDTTSSTKAEHPVSDTLDTNGTVDPPRDTRSVLEYFKFTSNQELSGVRQQIESIKEKKQAAMTVQDDPVTPQEDTGEQDCATNTEELNSKPNHTVKPRRQRLVRASDLAPEKRRTGSSKVETPEAEQEPERPASEAEQEQEQEPKPDTISATRRFMSNYFGVDALQKASSTSATSTQSVESEKTLVGESTELVKRARSNLKTYSKTKDFDGSIKKQPTKKSAARRKKSAYSESDNSESDHNGNDFDSDSDFMDPKADEEPDPSQRSIVSMFSMIPQTKPKTEGSMATKKKVKEAQRKSAFSDSNDSLSGTDDDLSDFMEAKDEGKPDPNQRSITTMFSKAPILISTFVRTERKLTPLSRSLLSGGLSNLSNTCYLNSVLQSLRNTSGCTEALFAIQERIRKLEESQGSQIKVTEYQRLVFDSALQVFRDLDARESREASEGPDEKSVYPKDIISTLRQGGSLFNTTDQQDAAEFLFYIISQFDDVLKALLQLRQDSGPETSQDAKGLIPEDWQPINDLFQVGTQTVTHCQNCPSVTVNMDRGIDLTVQIDADNPTQIRDLDWGISESMKMEHLKDDNKRFCEKCDSKEDAHVYHYLTSLPKIMILRLQRYNFKESAVKIQNGVSCTEKLNFEKWMANDYKGPHPTYELCAVIVHRGQVITSGHYYVYIKKTVEIETVVTKANEEPRMEKKTFHWLKYNDSKVTPVSDGDMAKVFSGGVGTGSGSDSSVIRTHSFDSESTEFSHKDASVVNDTVSFHDLATPYVYIYRRMDEDQ